MMGRSHAVSGAAVWLGGCVVASAVGAHLDALTLFVGAGVTAGAALLPDLDHPCSRVARSCGPVSRLVAKGTARLSARIHAATRTSLDRPDRSGHRTVLHTACFAVLAGLVTAAVCSLVGHWAAAAVLGGFVGLGWSSVRSRGALVAAGTAASLAAWALPAASWWWLGLPIAVGCLAHCLGDALTNSGCPILWPLVIAGRRWFPVGPPKAWRFGTDGPVERWLVMPLLLVALAGEMWLLGGALAA